MRLYTTKPKLIGNQLGCLYRQSGANFDGAACFLAFASLISQQSVQVSDHRERFLSQASM
jgi:hypothetical protein